MKNTEQWLVDAECIECGNYRPQRGIVPSGCKLTGTTLIGRRSADDTNPCPQYIPVNPIVFSHAGHDHILSNLKLINKERYGHETYNAFLQYYTTKVKVKILRYDNSGFSNMQKKSIQYKCTSITILEILNGEIDEDLSGFIKFLEYCFDFQIIDIQDGKLKRM